MDKNYKFKSVSVKGVKNEYKKLKGIKMSHFIKAMVHWPTPNVIILNFILDKNLWTERYHKMNAN